MLVPGYLSNRLQRKLLLISILVFLTSIAPAAVQPPLRVWGTRPLISYFALTQSLSAAFQFGAGLTDTQFALVEQVAYREAADLQALFQRSQVLIAGDAPLWWKRWSVLQMGYNRQIKAILSATDNRLQTDLDTPAYQRLVSWVEQRWPLEQRLHNQVSQPLNASAPRTFRVYATRYDSNGRYTAALPDKCVKFTNGGNRICEEYGYRVGVRYDIFITYTKSVGVTVAEAGPWNVDDTFWATWNDPTPRRMFADLGLGIPEAQAAYFNGYNGGKDQYGRKVTAPFGIDLAPEVSADIGLKANKNDWVTVTFQWTAGWDQTSGAGNTPGVGATGAAGGTAQAVVPVEVATPEPDGSLIHIVQPGQTLWDIAVAYDITLRMLYSLNHLDEKSVIWPGDHLLIRPADPTSIASPEITSPVPDTLRTHHVDVTGTAWAAMAFGTQAVDTVMAQIYAAQTSRIQTESPARTSTSPILVFSLVILIAGGLLLLVGGLLRKDR